MALGGGTFLVQNKVLPGSYINFISAARASAVLSDRGVATMPLELDWGPDEEVFAVENSELQKDSVKIFGHAYTDEEMRPLRELFGSIRRAYLFKLNSGGEKAANTFAEAKYTGRRGNALSIVVERNEAFEEGTNEAYDVSTLLDGDAVDMQKGVKTAAELEANDFVTFKKDVALAATAAAPLEGGTDGTVKNAAYQKYLDKIEAYTFNTMGCATEDPLVKGLFAAFTKRLRDECGVKFQTVLFRQEKADYEGVISVENGLEGADGDPSLVYWVTGAEAGCEVNKSLTNRVYSGEYAVNTDYTQTQLENAVRAGKLLFHKVGDDVRLLTDINTFTSVTDTKSSDFGSNQTVRVLDQIGNDIASLFNTKYLGKVQNDNAGRISLWNDIVSHHNQMQTIRAIENFSGDNVTVEKGDLKKSVVVTDYVTPVNAMEQLYMTVVVE